MPNLPLVGHAVTSLAASGGAVSGGHAARGRRSLAGFGGGCSSGRRPGPAGEASCSWVRGPGGARERMASTTAGARIAGFWGSFDDGPWTRGGGWRNAAGVVPPPSSTGKRHVTKSADTLQFTRRPGRKRHDPPRWNRLAAGLRRHRPSRPARRRRRCPAGLVRPVHGWPARGSGRDPPGHSGPTASPAELQRHQGTIPPGV